MTNIANYSAKLYPDLTLNIGLIPRKSQRKKAEGLKKAFEDKIEGNTEDYNGQHIKQLDNEVNLDRESGCDSTLGRGSQFSQSKKRYGLNGLTRHGKRSIRNMCLLMEREYGKATLSFVTPTMPNYNLANLGVANENFHEVVRYFNQRVRRYLKRINKPLDMVACIEIQPKRLKNRNEVGLHLHMLLRVREPNSKTGDYLTEEQLNQMWIASIEDQLRRFGGNLSQVVKKDIAVQSRQIEKSAVRYLAKYMSKNPDMVDKVIELGRRDELPKQWWCCSKEIRQKYKDSIQDVCLNLAAMMMESLEELKEAGLIKWGEYIDIYVGWKKLRLGCVVKFTEAQYQHLCQIIKENEVSRLLHPCLISHCIHAN